jgi:hypothetical protein
MTDVTYYEVLVIQTTGGETFKRKKLFQVIENKCIYELAFIHVHSSTSILEEEARQTHR